LGRVLAPILGSVPKNPFIQDVKSRLRTSVIKEGTANGKHKEYRSPCIAAPTFLLRA